MKNITVFVILFFLNLSLPAQAPQIVSGPVTSYNNDGSLNVWLLASRTSAINFVTFDSNVYEESIWKFEGEKLNDTLYSFNATLEKDFYNNPSLSLGYLLDVVAGEPTKLKLERNKQKQDFSFLLGSCTWPFKPKNKKWNIFNIMKDTPSDFMLWMGDNIYLLRGEWNEKQKVLDKYIKYRTQPQLNEFLKSRPQYATWDDHDFGPNNSDSNFENKAITLAAFKQFWINPNYGTEDCEGVFFSMKQEDAEFFVLDSRTYKDGEQSMYGECQLNWLKRRILASDAKIKFIVGGSQFLVESGAEDWADCPKEKADFFQFIKENQITGIVFLSGDRHLAEASEIQTKGMPRILEFTVSPLTSFTYPFPFSKNDHRIKGTFKTKRNFGRISLTGIGKERKLKTEVMNHKGKLLWEYDILLNEFLTIE